MGKEHAVVMGILKYTSFVTNLFLVSSAIMFYMHFLLLFANFIFAYNKYVLFYVVTILHTHILPALFCHKYFATSVRIRLISVRINGLRHSY